MENITLMLRQIKDAGGYNECRLAKELGVSQPTVNRMLRGAGTSVPTYLRIIELHKKIKGGL